MLEIEMSKDIRDFAPKVIGPFTMRQIVCIAIVIAIAIPIILIQAIPLSYFWKFVVATIIGTPVIICGWASPFGMNPESFAMKVVKQIVMGSTRRKYVENNMFHEEYMQTYPDPVIKKTKKSKTIKRYK